MRNAARLMRAGAHSVKLRAGVATPDDREDHRRRDPGDGPYRFDPQSIHTMGGFKVQGTEPEHARKLVQAAKSLEHAGCFSVVLEGVPVRVAEMVTEAITIPTIGIGAGMHTDGRCSSITTCSASKIVSCRSSCAATPTSRASRSRR